MTTAETTLVTGGFSYTGRYITAELLDRGHRVRTMTGHPERPHPFGNRVDVVPYSFHEPEALRKSMEGIDTVYNTYWVRFNKHGLTFRHAVENTRVFLEACEDAGVERFVHISVSNPSLDSELPYYAGKAETEELVRSSGLSWRIIRPTLILGKGDILVNNVAWLLRRSPFFVIPGDGEYRLQPVTAEDVARIAVDAAKGDEEATLDAAGPEILTFDELVRSIADVVPKAGRIVHAPPRLALFLCRLAGIAVRDVILTWDELEGLRQEMLVSQHEPLGRTGFTGWLRHNQDGLGDQYASEITRHFRDVDATPHVPRYVGDRKGR